MSDPTPETAKVTEAREIPITEETRACLIAELESWDRRFDGPQTILQNILEWIAEDANHENAAQALADAERAARQSQRTPGSHEICDNCANPLPFAASCHFARCPLKAIRRQQETRT